MIRALFLIGAATAAAYFYGKRRTAGPAQRARLAGQETVGVPNDVLAERVRAQLRGLVSRPEAVSVLANAGTVTLSGTLSTPERERVLREVLAVPGVVGVVNQMEASGAVGEQRLL